ncbi:YitT family protein [Paraliobacillus sp. JSM ZJ581]|uniref:YczE/YyaS/YitT family protein n=1 Tax=Paraliobacillus sp. JSM ZJ581 TaxID=3342118 RepID=UPI0035A8479E
MKNIGARILFFIIGLVVLSFGVSMTIKADLGAGAWDALNVGLAEITGFTVGNWVIIIGLILMIVNAIIVKTKPDYFALITVLLIGFMIDFWLLIVMDGWNIDGLLVQILSLTIGILILGLGVSMYLQPQFPLNPVDGLMVSLQQRFHLSTRVAKTLGEVLAFVLAFIVGGPIGIGTFIILFGIGPSIQLFEPTAKKIATRLDHSFDT